MLPDGRIDETVTLRDALAKHLGPLGREGSVRKHWQLRGYGAQLEALTFFLKQEAGLRGKAEGYWPLDPAVSLGENLKGKSVVEYPVIHVVLPEHRARYEAAAAVMSDDQEQGTSDDEDESEDESESSEEDSSSAEEDSGEDRSSAVEDTTRAAPPPAEEDIAKGLNIVSINVRGQVTNLSLSFDSSAGSPMCGAV